MTGLKLLPILPLLAVAVAIAGCDATDAESGTGATGQDAIDLRSSAFDAGEPIPTQYTADGEDMSPPLEWTGVPEAAQSLALIVDDPDAPTDEPWVHWVIYNLPGDLTGLPRNIPQEPIVSDRIDATQGVNAFEENRIGYRGPAPPAPDDPHTYRFRLYALDQPLNLESGMTKEELLTAIEGHVIATGKLTGTYDR
ncbi:MAG: YbhB/YbcL family Raf kinase inhibitor-like protein [Phycisphaeraceae bacterium]